MKAAAFHASETTENKERMYMNYHTLAVHSGRQDEKNDKIKPVNYPVYLSSTFVQNSLDEFNEFMYSRSKNPTRDNVEQAAAQLEGAKYGLAMSSGMAAVSLVFSLVRPGEKVLVNTSVYGGTWNYISHIFPDRGIEVETVKDFSTYSFDHLDENVTAVYLETPSNPLMEVTDIKDLAHRAKEKGLLMIVDNTFMTSYYQRPLDLGADIVLYSATKYYAGHSDIIAGLVCLDDDELYTKLKFNQKTLGATLDPFSSFILARGIKTLPLRMDRHNENAQKVAEFFEESGAADRVYYPGLKNDPGYETQRRQASGNGAVLSVDLSEEYDLTAFCNSLRYFDLAVSLGGVESLICHPASMTHEEYTDEEQAAIGLGKRLLRLSVGIEDADDLVADIKQALEKSKF